VFRNPKYVAFLAAYASSMLVLFAYISASPFILQQGYGLSPLAFGLCFAANAVGIGVGCAVAGRFADSYRGLRIGGGASVFMAIVTAAALWMKAPIAVVEPAFFLLMFAFGMIQPAGTSIDSTANAIMRERLRRRSARRVSLWAVSFRRWSASATSSSPAAPRFCWARCRRPASSVMPVGAGLRRDPRVE